LLQQYLILLTYVTDDVIEKTSTMLLVSMLLSGTRYICYFPGGRLQYVKARDAHRKVELNPCKNDLGVARALLDEIGLITSRWSGKEPALVARAQEIGRTGIVS